MTLINDPRADLNKISAELIKLEGKRIDLESTKSRLEDELANTERQNKALEETINKKKDSLMQTTSQKQDTLKEAQTNTEFQIMALKKEQAELKAKISELLKLNEEVGGRLTLGARVSEDQVARKESDVRSRIIEEELDNRHAETKVFRYPRLITSLLFVLLLDNLNDLLELVEVVLPNRP